jgi:AraC-like DNA-binding protein
VKPRRSISVAKSPKLLPLHQVPWMRRMWCLLMCSPQIVAGLADHSHVDRDVLRVDLKSANPMLRQLAIEYIGQRCPPRVHTMADRVRHALMRSMGASRATKKDIAALFAMHPRTLQRRLQDEGVTFEAIREDVYKNAALHLLRESDIPLTQLAGALGFSEQSALSRSCARWFGMSPSGVRRGVDHR